MWYGRLEMSRHFWSNAIVALVAVCGATATFAQTGSEVATTDPATAAAAVPHVSIADLISAPAASAADPSILNRRSVFAGAQIEGPAPPAPTPRHTGVQALFKNLVSDARHLPSKENLWWAAGGGAMALAVHPLDDDIHEYFATGGETAKKFFKPGAILGQSYTLFSAATIVYATGRLKDQPRVSHVGMDLLQALLISEGMTQLIKVSVGRERPDGSDNNSFPSGHAADTFAFATALERHLNWRYFVPAYAFSSYVAFSRVPADRHWFSDAMFGTAVGIIAGRTVTSNEASRYPVTVTAVPGGAAILFTRRND
jgi:membrane-associated phospholipid phosphatase